MTTHAHLGTLSKRLFILFLPCFNLRGAQGILGPYRLGCTLIAESAWADRNRGVTR